MKSPRRRKSSRGSTPCASRDNVRVVARFRPLNSLERSEGSTDIARIAKEQLRVSLKTPTHRFGSSSISCSSPRSPSSPRPHIFNFDYVFSSTATQSEVFARVGLPIINWLFQGYNGTVFAYGQTGSGKTYTMLGSESSSETGGSSIVMDGLIPKIVDCLYSRVHHASSDVEFRIQAQFVEIYREKLVDLLVQQAPYARDRGRGGHGPPVLKIREDRTRGVFLDGAKTVYCSSVSEVLQLIQCGNERRIVSGHRMNARSSRSHAVFVLMVSQTDLSSGEKRSGRLFLVDLAGSEQVKKTHAEGADLDDARFINLSLTTLGRVIHSLTDGEHHIPYRESTLTRLLQDSLGGNSKTFLVINASPASYNYEETLSTLRFGERAKTIRNRAKVNLELDPKVLRKKLNQARAVIARQRKYLTILLTRVGVKKEDLQSTLDAICGERSRDAGEGDVEAHEVGSVPDPARSFESVKDENKRLVSLLRSQFQAMKGLEIDRRHLVERLAEVREELRSRHRHFHQIDAELKAVAGMSALNFKLESEVELMKLEIGKVEREKKEHVSSVVNLQKKVDLLEHRLFRRRKSLSMSCLGECAAVSRILEVDGRHSLSSGDLGIASSSSSNLGIVSFSLHPSPGVKRTQIFRRKRRKRRKSRRRKPRGSCKQIRLPGPDEVNSDSDSTVPLENDGLKNENSIPSEDEVLADLTFTKGKLLEEEPVPVRAVATGEDFVLAEVPTSLAADVEVVEVAESGPHHVRKDMVSDAPSLMSELPTSDSEEVDKDDEESVSSLEDSPQHTSADEEGENDYVPGEETSLPTDESDDSDSDYGSLRELLLENRHLAFVMTSLNEKVRVLRSNTERITRHNSVQTSALLRDLANRTSRCVELELRVEQKKDRLRHLPHLLTEKSNVSQKSRRMRKKEMTLTHRKNVYHREVLSRAESVSDLERKLKFLNERIQNLEMSLEYVIKQNHKRAEKCLKERARIINSNESLYREVRLLRVEAGVARGGGFSDDESNDESIL